MSTETSCHFGHLQQVSNKTLSSLILYNFFHDFIHEYSPRGGAKISLGTCYNLAGFVPTMDLDETSVDVS